MIKLQSSYDAIVIGSGVAGSSLAFSLSRRGWKVLVVEDGALLSSSQRTSNSVGIPLSQIAGDRNFPRWPVGGQSKFYGAALYRLRENDFQSVEHEEGLSPPWPISYWDLEPYYQLGEELYRVHGASDGDSSEPPRSKPFPHGPIPHSATVLELVNRLKASGVSVSAIPVGLDYGPNGKCVLCHTCDGYYCQLDAKMDAEIAALRPGLATGNVQLATNTECVRICVNSSGSRATGAVLRQDGAEYVINAEVIAVCAGVERTAALLRRSRTDKHPEGLGNNTGCLGRYLAGHAVGTVFPLINWRKLPPMHTKTFAINSYYHGGSDWPYPLGVVQATGQMPFWKEASLIVRPFARSIGVRSIMCFYMAEALPTHQSRLTFSGERVVGRVEPTYNLLTFDRLRRTARDLFRGAGYWTIAPKQLPSLWHFVGTARMGTDPSISVVDPCCQVHGIKQLFVIDASVLPSAGSVNTALTIIALALRAGDFIASGKPVSQAVPRTSLQPGPISSQPLYIH